MRDYLFQQEVLKQSITFRSTLIAHFPYDHMQNTTSSPTPFPARIHRGTILLAHHFHQTRDVTGEHSFSQTEQTPRHQKGDLPFITTYLRLTRYLVRYAYYAERINALPDILHSRCGLCSVCTFVTLIGWRPWPWRGNCVGS